MPDLSGTGSNPLLNTVDCPNYAYHSKEHPVEVPDKLLLLYLSPLHNHYPSNKTERNIFSFMKDNGWVISSLLWLWGWEKLWPHDVLETTDLWSFCDQTQIRRDRAWNQCVIRDNIRYQSRDVSLQVIVSSQITNRLHQRCKREFLSLGIYWQSPILHLLQIVRCITVRSLFSEGRAHSAVHTLLTAVL